MKKLLLIGLCFLGGCEVKVSSVPSTQPTEQVELTPSRLQEMPNSNITTSIYYRTGASTQSVDVTIIKDTETGVEYMISNTGGITRIH